MKAASGSITAGEAFEIDGLRDDALRLLLAEAGNWWCDERRFWCAYCGIPLRRSSKGKARDSDRTRDHVIPRANRGRFTTIPCCRGCNRQKGSTSLPEFMMTPYFLEIRARKHRNKWHISRLWLAFAIAAMRHSRVADTMTDGRAS